MNTATKHTNQNRRPSFIYYFFCIIALIVIGGGLWWAYPPILIGINQLPAYANISWAHEPLLVETLLAMLGMIWLAVSSLFWGGWLLRRSVRKIKGRQWRIVAASDNALSGNRTSKNKLSGFFPPVLRYLKFSCYYLVFVLFFVILQYPLQFLVF